MNKRRIGEKMMSPEAQTGVLIVSFLFGFLWALIGTLLKSSDPEVE